MSRIVQRASEDAARPVVYRWIAGFVVAFGLTALLAVDGGGYDTEVRHNVALVIWGAIALGLAFGFLPRSRPDSAVLTAIGGLAALAILSLLAFSWTESDERTTAELARVLQYLGIVTLAYLGLNRHTWHGAAVGFACAALVIPLLAVASRLLPETFPDEVAELLNTDRLSFPLDYWNATACWGAMAIAVALGWSSHGERLATRGAVLAATPIAVTAVYLSYSRAGVAATILAVIVAIALARNRWTTLALAVAAGLASVLPILAVRGNDEIARGTGDGGAGSVALAMLLAVAICAGAGVASGLLGLDRVRMRRQRAQQALIAAAVCLFLGVVALEGPIQDGWKEFRDQRTVASGSDPTGRLTSLGGSRYVIWSGAMDAFRTDEARGIGPGSFEFEWNRLGDEEQFIRDAHSLYLEQAAELGLPGLVAILVFLGAAGVAGFNTRLRATRDRDIGLAAGLGAAFVVFLFYAGVDWIWEMGAIGTLALGGIAVVGAGGLERAGPRKLVVWQRLALAAVAVFALAAQLPSLVLVDRTRAADEALQAGDTERARELSDQAISAEPWGASGYAIRAAVERAAGDLEQAEEDALEAAEREPTNFRHPLFLAQVAAERGERQEMDVWIADARELAPRSPFLIEGAPFLAELEETVSERERPGSP